MKARWAAGLIFVAFLYTLGHRLGKGSVCLWVGAQEQRGGQVCNQLNSFLNCCSQAGTCCQLLAHKSLLSSRTPLPFPSPFPQSRELAGVERIATYTAKNSCGSMVNKGFSVVDEQKKKESVFSIFLSWGVGICACS